MTRHEQHFHGGQHVHLYGHDGAKLAARHFHHVAEFDRPPQLPSRPSRSLVELCVVASRALAAAIDFARGLAKLFRLAAVATAVITWNIVHCLVAGLRRSFAYVERQMDRRAAASASVLVSPWVKRELPRDTSKLLPAVRDAGHAAGGEKPQLLGWRDGVPPRARNG